MDLFIYTLRSLSGAIITPPLMFLLLTLAIVLYLKNKKIAAMQKIILGGSVNSALELTLSQLVLGIIAGIIASLLLTSIGIVFNESSGIVYLFFISIVLMFVKPRLICFSYSGAILGLISIILKIIDIYFPHILMINLDLDIFNLVMIVGIFHVIEGILVIIDGDRGAIPVFTHKDGKILGGYALKRYWVVPVAVIIGLNVNTIPVDYITESISNPDWWPLIKSTSIIAMMAGSLIISIMPFYMVLGYSSITFTRSKKGKAISSGIHILCYGLILTLAAQITRAGILAQLIVIIFMALAHEFMLRIQAYNENRRNPIYVSDEEGLVILDIAIDSKIRDFGINIKNKLISINDKKINSESEIYEVLRKNLYNAELKIKDSEGNIKEVKFKHNKNTRLGILLVPREVQNKDIASVGDQNFGEVLDLVKKTKNNLKK